MSEPEFRPWPKIARLNRDIIITEMIDGTNAAVGIMSPEKQADWGLWTPGVDPEPATLVYAQSRTRIITPNADNFGFAAWVQENREALITLLGDGLHLGEWWGKGIQRGYGQKDKQFSLFNVKRFDYLDEAMLHGDTPFINIGAVPILYEGPLEDAFGVMPWDQALDNLRADGSRAAPGFMHPEGIVVFHTAASTSFKVTLEGDEQPKGVAR